MNTSGSRLKARAVRTIREGDFITISERDLSQLVNYSSFASFARFESSSPSEATRGRAKEFKEVMWPLATEVLEVSSEQARAKDDTLAEQPLPVENNTRIYRL